MTPTDRQIEALGSGGAAPPRIVVLAGKEPWLIAEGSRRLESALAAAHGALDRFRFDGRTAEPADVFDELRSFALIQHHKLVIVDDADRFLAGGGAEDDDDEGGDPEVKGKASRRRRSLETYAASPSAEATLLLRAAIWRPGNLDKLIDAVGVRIKCEPVPEREAEGWCVRRAALVHGAKIARDAAALLVERIGPDLGRLDAELGKLAAYAGDAAVVSRDDVVALAGHSRQEKAWILQEAILTGRPATAAGKLRELFEISRVPEELVMWAIGDLLRKLHAATRLHRGGVGPGALRSELRLFGPGGDRIIDVARRAEPRRLAQLLQMAVETDAATKSGLGDSARNLEALTLRVTDSIRCV